jgi:hypothetical protein
VIGREIRIIDYYEAAGVDLGHYVRELAARPYVYAGHIVPHDAQAKELGTGKSRLEVLESLTGAALLGVQQPQFFGLTLDFLDCAGPTEKSRYLFNRAPVSQAVA